MFPKNVSAIILIKCKSNFNVVNKIIGKGILRCEQRFPVHPPVQPPTQYPVTESHCPGDLHLALQRLSQFGP